MAATFTQAHYRFRDDRGDELGAAWLAAEDTAIVCNLRKNYRVRFAIQAANSAAYTTKTFILRYSLNGAAYAAVTSSTPIRYAYSREFTNGADTTEQLTAGTGTFVEDNNGMVNDTATSTSMGGDADTPFELEYVFKLDAGGAALRHGDTIALRVYDSTSALAAYTVSATLTVAKPIGKRKGMYFGARR